MKIKSKTPLIYDARKQLSGEITVELVGWSYSPQTKSYSANVMNYVKTLIAPEEDDVYDLQVIEQKTVIYGKEQIDQLFAALQNPIEVTESYTDEMDQLISTALLYVTQTDLCENGTTIYGGQPSDWEITT